MTERLKEFLKVANGDEALVQQIKNLAQEENRDKVIQKSIQIAREAGFELDVQDFEAQEEEVEDAEMEAVAGGWCRCLCAFNGGGAADEEGKVCVCVTAGVGQRKSDGGSRCVCVELGLGEG